MADRYPIIYNSSANQLQEIASGDNLDLSGNNIINLVGIAVTNINTVGVVTASRFVSNVATGTAPFTVSSTTVVTNLNADLLDGYSTASANTANTVVIRDASGNFSAGTITANLTGNVTGNVTGNINSVGVNTLGSVFVGTDVGISTTRTTVATTSATTIDSFAVATFRSARVQVQITQSTNYQATDILVIHDGSVADLIEYGSIATNDYLGSFTATVSGGNCLLQINMNSATSATVKVLSQRITV